MEQISILIADDHPMFRFGMRARLAAEPDLVVVGEAGTGEEAVALATSHVASILGKLGVESRTAAATYAVRHGLV